MKERVRTLLLHASGAPRWERVVVDTLSAVLGVGRAAQWTASRLPAEWARSRLLRSLLGDGYGALSYVLDWRDAFTDAAELDVEVCNINDVLGFRRALGRIRDWALIVVLHSAAGDDISWLRRASPALQARRGRLVVFFGNEYALMKDKRAFARETGADFIVSQLPRSAAEWLYHDLDQSRLVLAPAALSPRLYRPSVGSRPVDIGFRGDRYSLAIGDTERVDFVERVMARAPALGLATDIQFGRYPRGEWSRFLGECKGIVGAESGTYYLERDDRTYDAVRRYLRQHPDVPFAEIYERFFKGYANPVSGKAISSRHFEPVGTKTCQILLEGEYNGILIADEHYVSVKRDLSDLDDALARFVDEGYRRAIAERAYEHVLARHTYGQRVKELLAVVLPAID